MREQQRSGISDRPDHCYNYSIYQDGSQSVRTGKVDFILEIIVKKGNVAQRNTLRLETLESRITPAVSTAKVYAYAPGFGSPAIIQVYNANNTLRFSINAFPNFLGGVEVAVGDINGDGYQDVIAAAEVGAGPNVKVFNGVTGQLIRNFYAFAPSFRGGLSVAAGYISNDTYEDIIVGPRSGADPHVEVFDGESNALVRSFDAFSPSFRGGINVAAGDVKDYGYDDIIASVASSGPPQVSVFDGHTDALIQTFYAYSTNFTGGVFVASADVNGDLHADIITGPGSSGGPENINVFSGLNDSLIESFFPAGNLSSTSGERVAASDLENDQRADIMVGSGPTTDPIVSIYRGLSIPSSMNPPLLYQQFALTPSVYDEGIFVA